MRRFSEKFILLRVHESTVINAIRGNVSAKDGHAHFTGINHCLFHLRLAQLQYSTARQAVFENFFFNSGTFLYRYVFCFSNISDDCSAFKDEKCCSLLLRASQQALQSAGR